MNLPPEIEKIRDELAHKYATGNNTVSYADTAEACAFAEGFNAAVRYFMKREINFQEEWKREFE